MEWKIYAENEPADYASDFFKKKIAAYPIVETDYMKTTASSPFRGERVYELPPIPDRGQSFFTRKPERK